MDIKKVTLLLDRWSILIGNIERQSKAKASQLPDGVDGRIRRTRGSPVIFDVCTHNRQKEIQNALCDEIPQWSDIIRSKPAIMDGYSWTRSDFIDLYCSHFKVVITKLKRLVKTPVSE